MASMHEENGIDQSTSAQLTYSGGRTGQFYHVTTTNDWPYNICGAQQDNSTLCGPSRKQGSIDISDWYDAGGCESGYIAANPAKPKPAKSSVSLTQ